VPTTVATTTGVNASIAKLPSRISSAKNAPAIGVSKLAATPAAPPAAINARDSAGLASKNETIRPAMAEPICTVGPSRPPESPAPTATAAPSADTTPSRADSGCAPRWTRASTSATPCGR
jgi:hypothetical protein